MLSTLIRGKSHVVPIFWKHQVDPQRGLTNQQPERRHVQADSNLPSQPVVVVFVNSIFTLAHRSKNLKFQIPVFELRNIVLQCIARYSLNITVYSQVQSEYSVSVCNPLAQEEIKPRQYRPSTELRDSCYIYIYIYIYTEWPQKLYTLFTHQYLWNKFK